MYVRERSTSNALGHEGEGQPGKDLTCVVGARDELEQEAMRDLAGGGASRAQVTELHMAHEVEELKHLRRS